MRKEVHHKTKSKHRRAKVIGDIEFADANEIKGECEKPLKAEDVFSAPEDDCDVRVNICKTDELVLTPEGGEVSGTSERRERGAMSAMWAVGYPRMAATRRTRSSATRGSVIRAARMWT